MNDSVKNPIDNGMFKWKMDSCLVGSELTITTKDICDRVTKQTVDFENKQVRLALIKLGWTPPKEKEMETKKIVISESGEELGPKDGFIVQGCIFPSNVDGEGLPKGVLYGDGKTRDILLNKYVPFRAFSIKEFIEGLGISPKKLREVADQCTTKSHYLAEKIKLLDGYDLKFTTPFFKEFVVTTPISAKLIISKLKKKNIFPGIDLLPWGHNNSLLISVTEKKRKADLDSLIENLKAVQNG